MVASKPVLGQRSPTSPPRVEIEMPAILRASQAIAAQTDLHRLVGTTVEQLRALAGATHVQLVLRDPDAESWLLQPDGGLVAGPIDVDDPLCGRLTPLAAFREVTRTGRPLLVEDARQDDRFAADPCVTPAGRCALLGVPLLSAGDLRGVLVLQNRLVAGAFGPGHLDAVLLLSGQLATAVDNALVYRSLEAEVARRTEALVTATENLERLRALVVTDTLTDVASRQHFEEAWPAEWELSRINRRSIGVLLIEVDQFCLYGTTEGRAAGDACLRAVARAITASVRDSDAVCRYTREQFAVVLPRAELRQAFAVAQRAHAAVQELALPRPGEIGRVTVSIGVAAHVPDAVHDPKHLIAAADAALHEARLSGYDQVVVMTPGPLDGE